GLAEKMCQCGPSPAPFAPCTRPSSDAKKSGRLKGSRNQLGAPHGAAVCARRTGTWLRFLGLGSGMESERGLSRTLGSVLLGSLVQAVCQGGRRRTIRRSLVHRPCDGMICGTGRFSAKMHHDPVGRRAGELVAERDAK